MDQKMMISRQFLATAVLAAMAGLLAAAMGHVLFGEILPLSGYVTAAVTGALLAGIPIRIILSRPAAPGSPAARFAARRRGTPPEAGRTRDDRPGQ